MNENDINNNTTIVVSENEIDGLSAQAYYDYYEVVQRQDITNTKLDNQFKLLNDGFTYLNCTLTVILLYFFIRKLMGRS